MRVFFIFFFSLFFLSNCTVSGTSLLGPILTASKTGSIYQTSLSYGSTKMLNKIKIDLEKKKKKSSINKIKGNNDNSQILLTVKSEKVEIFNIFEIEHLP